MVVITTTPRRHSAEDVETRFDTSNFEIDRPLPEANNEKVIILMKEKLVGQIRKEFIGLIAEAFSYLKENNDEDKKAKGKKKCDIKRKLNFQDYKNCLEAAQIENKINQVKLKSININIIDEK